METATAATEDLSSSSSTSASTSAGNATAERWIYALWRHHQHLMDRFVPYVKYRWIAVLVIAFIYFVRVLWLQGFHVVTYAVGIYVLNLLIGFLSPQVDPEIQNGPVLPIRGSDEFRPFVRRVPEFKFWLSVTHAFLIAFVMTFFPVFDVPVFWPILLFYWVVLFTATMRRQITHMIKYKYVPFTFGKQKYGKKAAAAPSAETAELLRA